MQQQSTKSDPDNSASIPPFDEIEKVFLDAGATPDQLEDIEWLVDYAATEKLTTFAALAKAIGVSAATVSKVLRGKYAAAIGSFCATIENFRAQAKEQQDLGSVVYVPQLSVVRRITQFCDLTRITKQIGIIWGKNQSGKTKALKYYADNTPMTAYCKLPAGGATKPSMKRLALARGGISTRKSYEELREVILQRFNPLWLPIADEFHQTIKGTTRGHSFRSVTIDRFREVRDECGCGLVICGTDQLPEMMEDERFKDFLGQVGNRGVLRMRIPTAPTKKDIELLAGAYGFEGEPIGNTAAIVRQIANENGIGKLSGYFAVARRLANKAHTRLTWKHFDTTHSTLASWAEGKFEEAA
ncbi:MAG TPA: hypothetical protein VNP98_17280 [Chthoniobacterales bacterium]|nr:hypothetical protein [Chthoniobacterales bacterium]